LVLVLNITGIINSGLIWLTKAKEIQVYGFDLSVTVYCTKHGRTHKVFFSLVSTNVIKTFLWANILELTTLPPSFADRLQILGALASWSPRSLSRPLLG
jgi:hypothetical protein